MTPWGRLHDISFDRLTVDNQLTNTTFTTVGILHCNVKLSIAQHALYAVLLQG